ncbi:MAG: DUF521 domain-containing protein [Firmicutes bacterium]|nr:DUF521 domain-containing protein [Bacillota bacterium]
MYLTDEEKQMLDGQAGELARQCMEILVTLGEINGAEKMLKIRSVHSPGVSYRVTGDAGLNYVVDASKLGTFRVPLTLNTIGIDADRWQQIGFPEEFSRKQLALLQAYAKMGAIPTCTCTPYLNGFAPLPGEHVAWGESSAIAYANSVLGARTNREGGPTALAAAVTGCVPAYGYHLAENRRADLCINVERNISSKRDFAVLGYYAGMTSGRRVPVFKGLPGCRSVENLKALSAAIATSGAVALFHIEGVTPDAVIGKADLKPKETVNFGETEYRQVTDKFNYQGDVDFVVIGCPHCSIGELQQLAALLEGKKVKADFWVCTSRMTKMLSDKMGFTEIIERAGARVVCDTCPVLCPTSSKGYKTILTNSAKLAHYAPGLWSVKTALIQTDQCISAALTGKWGGSK